MRKRIFINLIKILLGVGILLVIFFKIGFRDIWQVFRNVDLLVVPIIFVCQLAAIMIGALSQWILIKPLYSISYSQYLKCYYPAFSVGLFAPGKIGEVSIVYFLKQKGISPGHGTAVLVVEKFIAFSVLGFLASLGFFVFFPFQTAIKFISLVITVGILALIMVLSPFGRNLVKKYTMRKHQDLFAEFSKTVFTHLKQHKFRVGVCFLLSLFKWAMVAYSVFLVLLIGFGVFVDFHKVLLINAVAIISGLIPITVNGLGIRQGIAIYLYNQIDIAGQVVVSMQIIGLIVQYFVGLFGLFMNWRKKPSIGPIAMKDKKRI